MNNPFNNSSFKFGFGFFETFRFEYPNLIFFEEHMARLNFSLRSFKLNPINENEIKKEVLRKIQDQKLKSARVRITVYLNELSQTQIHYEVIEFKKFFSVMPKIKLAKNIIEHGSYLRRHKTTSYFLNYYELKLARELDFDEAIFIDNKNHILEGTRTNIFFIYYKSRKEKFEVVTPPMSCGILPGIGRKMVIKLLRDQGHKVKEKTFNLKNLTDVKEIFLVNSLNGVIPVYNFENLKFIPYHSLQIKNDFESNFYKSYSQ